MSTLALKKIGDIQTLALGYTHEATINIADDVPTGGVLNVTVGGSQIAGKIGKASVIVQYRRIARARPLPGVRVYAVGGHQGAIGVDPLKGVVIPCCHCHRAGDGAPAAGILVDSCASNDHHMGGSGVYVVFCCHRERWRSAQRSSRLIAQSALP